MRPGLWFVVPIHERLNLTAICLRQLRRTCEALDSHGIDATAVLIADRDNLHRLKLLIGEEMLGFGTVERDNRFVSRKFNDGIQLALDPAFNPRPADYVVPCGSDDWVDHRILIDLPPDNTVVGFQRMSFVREDGGEIATLQLNYRGGAGIRIYPAALLVPLGYRPADEDRPRGCDTSILLNLTRHHGTRLKVEHRHYHDRQIVDWKTRGVQLNSYADLGRHRRVDISDPFLELAGVYPDESLDEIRAHYTTQATR